MNTSEFIKQAANLLNIPKNLSSILPELPRSWAERGLTNAAEKLDNKFPPGVAPLTTRLQKKIDELNSYVDIHADNSWDKGNWLNQLHNQLRDAERRPTQPDTSWWQDSMRQKKLSPVISRLLGEQTRLDKLSPGQMAREKFRMNSIEAMKAPPVLTDRQQKIQQLADLNRSGGKSDYYW